MVDRFAVSDVVAIAEPLLQPAERTLRAASARRIAIAGRVGAVWLPAFAISSRELLGLGHSLAVSSVLALAWLVALQRALTEARPTLWALGTPVAAAVGSGAGCVIGLAVDALLGEPISRWGILWTGVGVFGLVTVWERIVATSIAGRQRVLVVGTANGGADLVEDLVLADRAPFELVGVVDDERETDRVAGVPVLGRLADLADVVAEHEPHVVVLANERYRGEAFDRLLEIAELGFAVVGLPEFYEYAFGRLPVRNMTQRWFMSIVHLYQRPYSRFAKRAFDVVVAGVGLVLTAPLVPLIALLVRRTPGPILFRQVRLGAGGRPFTIFKFRTMRQDAEAAGAVWAAEHDPRVTSIGRLLRKTRLDELPQLFNVLVGDMSIVGPRPERPEFLDQLRDAVPFWTRRHLVKPGITGWAQVRRGYTSDAAGTADKLSYDLWYLRHRSLVVDLAICVKTFSTLVSGSGAR